MTTNRLLSSILLCAFTAIAGSGCTESSKNSQTVPLDTTITPSNYVFLLQHIESYENTEIDVTAFVDTVNLPIHYNSQKLVLVDSPDNCGDGSVMLEVYYPDPSNPNGTLTEAFQRKIEESQPVKVHISNAIVRKQVVQYGGLDESGGGQLALWHLETSGLTNMAFYRVYPDGREELLEETTHSRSQSHDSDQPETVFVSRTIICTKTNSASAPEWQFYEHILVSSNTLALERTGGENVNTGTWTITIIPHFANTLNSLLAGLGDSDCDILMDGWVTGASLTTITIGENQYYYGYNDPSGKSHVFSERVNQIYVAICNIVGDAGHGTIFK